MQKRKPRFALADIKRAFADAERLNRSYVSRQGADALDMTDRDFVSTIQALRPADFEKSMTSIADGKIWQDVYKPKSGGRMLYVKFTFDARGRCF